MSTYHASCVVCGTDTYCSRDEHALGCGDGCYGSGPQIEFCSAYCFVDLERRLAKRRALIEDEANELDIRSELLRATHEATS